MGLKKALVISWPSIDGRQSLSDWEQKVTDDLLEKADFVPNIVLFAYPTYVKNWLTLFNGQKFSGGLIDSAIEHQQKLWQQLEGYDIALTMGIHAMYCLTGQRELDVYRGTHIDSPYVPGLQVVPTYDPELFSRKAWNERPIVVAAARKANQRYVDIRRTIHIPENIADLYIFSTKYIQNEIAFDVETNRDCRITEFSIAASPTDCLYVQLEDRACNSIWSEKDELDIFLWLHFLAKRKDLTWIMHNATYDLTYLDRYGIKPAGPIVDTMLRHHAWQPELEKSLGFLASLHLPTRAWKHLRTKAKKEYAKKGAL